MSSTKEATRVRDRFERLLAAGVAIHAQHSLDQVLQEVVDAAPTTSRAASTTSCSTWSRECCAWIATPAASNRSKRSRTRVASFVEDMSRKMAGAAASSIPHPIYNYFSTRSVQLQRETAATSRPYDTHTRYSETPMFLFRHPPLVASTLLLAACAANQTPVPVVGSARDVAS